MKKNIAVITGGTSGEREISLKSVQTVLDHIDTEKYNAFKVLINGSDWNVLYDGKEYSIDKNNFSFRLNQTNIKFDGVFNIIHGTPGEDGKIQGYFDIMGIPYTSCGVLAASLTFSKNFCNRFLNQYGIRTGKSILFRKNNDPKTITSEISIPCFVKPNNGGSSIGASKVNEASELQAAINKAFIVDTEIIIEEFLPGTEVTCGVVEYRGNVIALPITEIVPKTDFFDYQQKYAANGADEITPARLSPEITKEIQETVVKVFKLLGCKNMSRIDFIIKENIPYLLEVNTLPGLSAASILPKQAKVAGIDLTELFTSFLDGLFCESHL